MSSQFTIIDAGNEVIMPPTKVLVVKQMENNPQNVVGKASEVRLIEGEMRSELAAKIMRRISFYAASTGVFDTGVSCNDNLSLCPGAIIRMRLYS